jgi:hypothetical protein
MYPIKKVSSLDMAFGCKALEMMPAMKEIPKEFKEFKDFNQSKWNKLFNDWFFGGLASLKITPKKGVDKNKALAHIKTIMGSFDPSHEHKEAGVAYLMSEWFEDATWEQAKKTS